jgi:exodeoxyribonuclease V beta subunit
MPTTPFEAKTVTLSQSNLIEASAGTGKTYSIAILSLRLLLEENIPIQEILMVTFTKAAVAELETRIRAFVRLAYNSSIGIPSHDDTIDFIVNESKRIRGEQETAFRLKNAVLFLDETAILTIHGFCQRTLSEFAFETNQVFGSDAMSESDLKEITINEVNRFWRRHVVVIETHLLAYLCPLYLNRVQLIDIIKNVLGGKSLLALAEFDVEVLSNQTQIDTLNQLSGVVDEIEKSRQEALDYIWANQAKLQKDVEANKNADAAFSHLFEDHKLLLTAIIDASSKLYVKKIFKEVLTLLEPALAAELVFTQQVQLYVNKIHQFAIKEICINVGLEKDRRSLMAFDDMVDRLHDAVVIRKNKFLITALQQKYKAVFIDEFQDTDKKQYEVFNELFGSSNILFYIGDPKQSIYAWRKADINTYFKAGNAVSNRYGMNTNYRSSNGIILAQNHFFKPDENFDTFHFDGAEDSIEYINVEPPENNEKGTLLYGNNEVVPITFFSNDNIEDIIETTVATVIELLNTPAYQINEKDKKRRVKPSDIGILVRAKDKGKLIKDQLAKYRIPAVTIDETKISDTIEAKELLYVMNAVNDINASNINKALLTGLTGYFIPDMLSLNQELVLNQFKNYHQAWVEEGVYVMLMKFMTDYRVKTNLLNQDAKNGERRLSNIFQLLELLHKVQIRNEFGPVELINWLQKTIEGQITEGDEFEQRIESDEDAVKIVTIHKSKGLEYNIVMAPFLDMNPKIHDISSYRDEATGDYLFANKQILNDDQSIEIIKQLEQENRRLIYVAITRSKYKCYINSNIKTKVSSLKYFEQAIKQSTPKGIEFVEENPEIDPDFRFNAGVKPFPIEYKKATHFSLAQKNWHKLSYTFLNVDHTHQSKNTVSNIVNPYDEFIFKKLKKGAYTGNLLHYIFEFIHFSDDANWTKTIATALKRLSPGNTDLYSNFLLEMLQHVTKIPLVCVGESFSLSDLVHEKRINEFEFDFSVQPFLIDQIRQLSTEEVPLLVKSRGQLEGMMNGKMDMFFEKNGKYYILDWKSNHLGDELTDYANNAVWAAMAENNYHLQYHIYTVALCKYLSSRLPDFNYERDFGGVIYLFVRGMRKDESTGIFFSKPDKSVIDALDGMFSQHAETLKG